MSAESVFNRDREGFLKCKDCPRRFLTKIGFENHSFIQHKKETKTKLGENQQSQTIEDESSFKQDTFGNVFFGSQVDPIQQRSSEHLIITHQCSECKKMFSSAIFLKEHLQNGQDLSSLHKRKDCNRAFTWKNSLENHGVIKYPIK